MSGKQKNLQACDYKQVLNASQIDLILRNAIVISTVGNKLPEAEPTTAFRAEEMQSSEPT